MKKGFYLVLMFLFVASGVALVYLGNRVQSQNDEYYKNGTETVATVVEKNFVDELDVITVSYTINDQEYRATLNKDVSIYEVGDTFNIYCKLENPTEFIYGSQENAGSILTLGGGFLCFLGFVFLIIAIFKKGKKKEKVNKEDVKVVNSNPVITDEIKVDADILKVYPTEANGLKSYSIECAYTVPNTDQKFTYICQGIPFDLETIINQKNIKTVPVYINKADSTKYRIDVDSLK